MIGWWMATALASGPWSGVDPGALRGLEPPVYLAPQAGWAADVVGEPGARVRVFVGHTEDEARAWLADERARIGPGSPRYPLGDEGWGNGHGLLLTRSHNVVVTVRREQQAAEMARQILDALVDDTGWPDAPRLVVSDRVARVDGAWARVSFRASGVTDPETFLPRPLTVVPVGPDAARVASEPRWVEARAWDAFGRYVDARWVRDDE